MRPLTRDEAFVQINVRLKLLGLSISLSTFSRMAVLYKEQFPKSQWIRNDRIVYGMPVVLYIYFLVRLHLLTNRTAHTRVWSQQVVRTLPGRFSDMYSTLSAIDTLMLQVEKELSSLEVA
jgi:hypothetical protein